MRWLERRARFSADVLMFACPQPVNRNDSGELMETRLALIGKASGVVRIAVRVRGGVVLVPSRAGMMFVADAAERAERRRH